MFDDVDELLQYIGLRSHREDREYEFKQGQPWDELKLKIVKSVLAMANLSGGGRIIIGVSENPTTRAYEPSKMTEDDSNTYKQDDVSQYVNEYAEPYIGLDLKHFSKDSVHFVVIDVSEFENEPIICKKSHDKGIYRGRVYCRTHKKAESSPDISASEMREIIELAVDKGIRKQMRRLDSYGIRPGVSNFEKERKGF